MPKVNAKSPLARSAAKMLPAMPTKMPEPSASATLREEAFRPCSAAPDRLITANEVLEVASPMPRPEKIQATAGQRGAGGGKAPRQDGKNPSPGKKREGEARKKGHPPPPAHRKGHQKTPPPKPAGPAVTGATVELVARNQRSSQWSLR